MSKTRNLQFRPAAAGDAPGMARVLAEIVAATGSGVQGDADFVRARYIAHQARLACTVAVEDGVPVGFQSLKRAWDGNPYSVATGWGIVGTHIAPTAARGGIGRALFEASRDAAERAGLLAIDATIGAENAAGLAYYDAMGFRTYRAADGSVSKRYDLAVRSG